MTVTNEDLLQIVSNLASGYRAPIIIDDAPHAPHEKWFIDAFPELVRSKILTSGPIIRPAKQWADIPDIRDKIFSLTLWIMERIYNSTVPVIAGADHESKITIATKICASFASNTRLNVWAEFPHKMRVIAADKESFRSFLSQMTKAFRREHPELRQLFQKTRS